jgi:hypothetical protein
VIVILSAKTRMFLEMENAVTDCCQILSELINNAIFGWTGWILVLSNTSFLDWVISIVYAFTEQPQPIFLLNFIKSRTGC